jgi:O-antigen/teichoic acid export membrane protein
MAAESIVRNAIFAGVSKISGAAFTAVLTIFLVRYLGPEEYGVFALALGVGGLMTVPADLGISVSVARFIAERRSDAGAMATFVADAIRLKVFVAGAASLALVAVAGPVANAYDTPDLAWPLRILAIATFGQSVMIMWATIFEAVGRISVYVRVVLAESALETTGSIVIVLLGTGATGAMVGRAAAYAFAAGFGLILVARTLDRSIRPRRGGHGHARRILGYGSALVIVDGAFTIFNQIDVLLIGAILSVTAVAQFDAAYRLAGLLYFIGMPIRSAVAPRLARGEEGPDHEALERTLRYVVLAQGVILAPLIVWAEPLTRIAFGTDYLESADVLRALAPFALLAAISPLLAGAANYLGAARRRVPIALVALGVNVAIDAALLKPLGIVAGAIGTDVAYVIYVGAHLHLCRDLAGLRLRPLVRPLAGSLAAAVVMGLVLLAFGTGADLAIPLVVIGGALGTAAYVAVLLASGQVTRQERTALWRRLRGGGAPERRGPAEAGPR